MSFLQEPVGQRRQYPRQCWLFGFRERVEAFMALVDRALAAPVGSLMRDKLCHKLFSTHDRGGLTHGLGA
jgi:hypothetical protein